MAIRAFPNWEELYRQSSTESMPWYYPELDPDLERGLAEQGILQGAVLDLGTGPGTQAIALAERGFEVTATDISEAAIAKANERAAAHRIGVRFLVDDILASKLDRSFEAVFDRGCFHVLDPASHRDYVATVAALLAPGGFLFLKCFSDAEPGTQGPYRFRPEEIRGIFGAAFEVLSIVRTVYQGTLVPRPQALFCILRKR